MSVPSIDNAETCDLGCVRNLAAYVKKNFAVVNVVYAQFEDEVHTISPAVSVAALFGGIGGNLGLFVGKSILIKGKTPKFRDSRERSHGVGGLITPDHVLSA